MSCTWITLLFSYSVGPSPLEVDGVFVLKKKKSLFPAIKSENVYYLMWSHLMFYCLDNQIILSRNSKCSVCRSNRVSIKDSAVVAVLTTTFMACWQVIVSLLPYQLNFSERFVHTVCLRQSRGSHTAHLDCYIIIVKAFLLLPIVCCCLGNIHS